MRWKWKPKAASGLASDCNNGCKKKPSVTARFFPLSGQRLTHRRTRPMQLRTLAGRVELQVLHGQDPADGHWGCPVRERWGLSCHQQLSLALEDKLAFTVTATASYAEAAAVAGKWGVAVDDSTLHALTQRLGAKAQARAQEALKSPPSERQPQRAPTPLAVLMLDGWQVRQRGPGWGKKENAGNPRGLARMEDRRLLPARTSWRHLRRTRRAGRENRGGVAGRSRGVWRARLHWEAQRAGLGRARATLVGGDGAPWIWNVAQDRWAGATQVLDFYHASQHLWELGRALHGPEEAATAQWVEPRRHQLRHGKEKRVLQEIAGLRARPEEAGEIIRREQNYFASHAGRMNYQSLHRRGWPIGSGPVESACRQRQCRFKRPGQFWTPKGMRHLGALTEARHNHHWDELWPTS